MPFYPVDLYGLCGDTANEQEGYRMHNTFTQSLLKDLLQSSQLPEHGLIHVSLNMDSYLFIETLTQICKSEH